MTFNHHAIGNSNVEFELFLTLMSVGHFKRDLKINIQVSVQVNVKNHQGCFKYTHLQVPFYSKSFHLFHETAELLHAALGMMPQNFSSYSPNHLLMGRKKIKTNLSTKMATDTIHTVLLNLVTVGHHGKYI